MKKTEKVKRKRINSYSIEDISSWLVTTNSVKVNENKSKITLPSLQRGFVWKPYQIEFLWDSILRGYPIGSLLMSQNGGYKELLDGQQRCTSIAIGFINPLIENTETEFLNLKKNIPSLWLDLLPVKNSKHGLKFSLRLLSRSHPWGYQLNDHRKTLSSNDRNDALEHFREVVKDQTRSFSELPSEIITPWDSYYPIPLYQLVSSDSTSFKSWLENIKDFIENNLKGVKTKHFKEGVKYDELDVENFKEIFDAIVKAKNTRIPEIVVQKEILEEEENNENSDDSTLFIRLNSEGTKISGEELIYSMLKASFPKSKELVEKIGLNFIAPSKIVNLFSRLSLMNVQEYKTFQKEMTLVNFRTQLKNKEYSSVLEDYIDEKNRSKSKAEALVLRGLDVVSNEKLPKIYSKDILNKSLDLFLVMLVFLEKNPNLTQQEKIKMYNSFHLLSLFNTDIKKTAKCLFEELNENKFLDWEKCVENLKKNHPELIIPLLAPDDFKNFINEHLLPEYLKDRNRHFGDEELLKEILLSNRESLKYLFQNSENNLLDEESLKGVTNNWNGLFNRVLWDKRFLVLCQREYFNNEFKDYMEFDGIEDTNRPWDWDHIYPSSWVYRKQKISNLVRWLINSNGNFRALSFNINRSQNNNESPNMRFFENVTAQKDSFIKENDLKYWLSLTNEDKKLIELNGELNAKIDAYVKAVFTRMVNIYVDIYNLFDHNNVKIG